MTPEELRSKVFTCTHCEDTGLPFVRDPSGKFYRFPPAIGAAGRAPLLFVGINPRVSASNRALHDSVVQDAARFGELARNRVGGSSYIGIPGLEQHYALHVRVVRALYPASRFEQVAAVTELHHCASASSVGLPLYWSRCAEQYFRSVLEIVSPVVIFAVGKHVAKNLRAQFGSGHDDVTWSTGWAPVIELPHPNSFGPKYVGFDTAIAIARHHIQRGGPARASGAPPSEQPSAPKAAAARQSSAALRPSPGSVMSQRETPPHVSHLVRKLEDSDGSPIKRTWTGNDQSARNHTGAVSLSESPLFIRLFWKRAPTDAAMLIGSFEVDLLQLLAEGYIRRDPSSPDAVRLRFYHRPSGIICIQANEQGPALPIGEMS